jgi:hypothetical protein
LAKKGLRVNPIRRIGSKIKGRLTGRRAVPLESQLPIIVDLTEFDADGVRFEITNMSEHYRVVNHGGETEYTHAMLANLHSDDVLYDVGANVGMVALHAAKKCRTIAFEPDPSFRSRLEANMALNPGGRLTVEPVAVSDHDDTVELFTNGAGGNSPSLAHHEGVEGRVSVTARSLDSLLAEGSLPKPTVIKMDIEGAEILALRGATKLLQGPDRPRALFIEVHDTLLPDFGSTPEEVHAVLEEFGYTNAVYRAKRADQWHLILERSAT